MKNILFVFGTRPEAIKMAPLINEAKVNSNFKVVVCSTGQHREMLEPILSFFEIVPDFDLNIMKPGQSLTDISLAVLQGVDAILKEHSFDAIIVQGDTTSCFIAGLAGFYHKVPVVHIEAGLRSGDIFSPFPEEFNRRATGLMAKIHFAPTESAKANLIREKYPEHQIFVTGNTGIDALFAVRSKIDTDLTLQEKLKSRFSFLNLNKKLILVTIHRRESFGRPIEEIMSGLKELSQRNDIEIFIPLHLNPKVRTSAEKIFADTGIWVGKPTEPKASSNLIWLSDPIDYIPFIYLMNRAHLIITDSGGVQEEAPSLGKPILVARENTERPEAISAGTSKLIPLQREGFLKEISAVLDDPEVYSRMAMARNPFGDGKSCGKILELMSKHL